MAGIVPGNGGSYKHPAVFPTLYSRQFPALTVSLFVPTLWLNPMKGKVTAMTPETTLASPPRTLLLVDNERGVLSALQRLLRNDGYEILTAGSGLAGLELMRAHEVGVVVSDGLMSGLNGAQFLREVRARFPNTVRIMLTGFTSPEVVHDALKTCGLFRFLSKPWDNEQLRETLREAFLQYELSVERGGRQVATHPFG